MVLTINGQVRELPIIAEHLLPHPPPGAGAGA
jgi:hypothetical protein